MKYLGVDYGSKRIGVAVSDALGTIAFPRETIVNDKHVLAHLKEIVDSEKVERIVVGDTRAFGGAKNAVTEEALSFSLRLEKLVGIPIIRAWEAGSSVEASRYAEKGNEHKDEAAAAVILQRYIDMKGSAVQ